MSILPSIPASDLQPATILVWLVNFPKCRKNIADYQGMLGEAEKKRAKQFKIADFRTRFIITHGILKGLLAKWAGTTPENLPIVHSPKGKPYLPENEIHFNLSYTQRYSLIAISPERPLGVDIERQRGVNNLELMLTKVLSPEEHKEVTKLPKRTQHDVFIDLWVRKEAIVKALGIGISFPLDEIAISLDEPARVESIFGEPLAVDEWQLHSLAVPKGWSAALAYQGEAASIVLERFP